MPESAAPPALPPAPAPVAPSSAPSPARVWAARCVAVGADLVQLGLPLLFGEGFLSPLDDALDLGVGALLIALLGWHWPFLPSLLAEALPGVDLFPTWTAAVLFVTRSPGGAGRRRWPWVVLGLASLVAAFLIFRR